VAALPQPFLDRLSTHDELIVSSRQGGVERSVRTWFAIAPDATVLLFASAFSLKARRWQRDPWVRLRIPGTNVAVEGMVHFLSPEEAGAVADLVTTRWGDWGATHVEGLRRMVRDGTHVLLRVAGNAQD
jgi:hypothetical protein